MCTNIIYIYSNLQYRMGRTFFFDYTGISRLGGWGEFMKSLDDCTLGAISNSVSSYQKCLSTQTWSVVCSQESQLYHCVFRLMIIENGCL